MTTDYVFLKDYQSALAQLKPGTAVYVVKGNYILDSQTKTKIEGREEADAKGETCGC